MIAAQDPHEPDDIIEQVVKEHKKLADFENDPKLEFEVYKVTIETIFSTLKNENKLRTFPLKSLKAYDEGLGKIAGRFYDLYISPIGSKLNKETIQPLIEDANRKLSAAISYVQGESMAELKGSDLDECLKYIQKCRSLLFDLKEHLMTIQFEES